MPSRPLIVDALILVADHVVDDAAAGAILDRAINELARLYDVEIAALVLAEELTQPGGDIAVPTATSPIIRAIRCQPISDAERQDLHSGHNNNYSR